MQWHFECSTNALTVTTGHSIRYSWLVWLYKVPGECIHLVEWSLIKMLLLANFNLIVVLPTPTQVVISLAAAESSSVCVRLQLPAAVSTSWGSSVMLSPQSHICLRWREWNSGQGDCNTTLVGWFLRTLAAFMWTQWPQCACTACMVTTTYLNPSDPDGICPLLKAGATSVWIVRWQTSVCCNFLTRVRHQFRPRTHFTC